MNTRQFRIGRLANLGQVIKALGKTIRAMADGSIESQVGAVSAMAWASCARALRHKS
jgi:hypothetical protein